MHTKVEEALTREPPVNEPFGKTLAGLRYDVPFLAQRELPPDRARYWGVGYCSRGLFKGRIVVPIKNRTGEIVAYIGRSLKEDDPEGKWRFPKGFHKSLEIFGIDRLARDGETREAVAKYGLIVVEGCFDVISLAEKGFKNAVSTLGSEVSPQQRALLVDPELNPSRRVTIFFDNDEAGKAGRRKLAGDLIYEAFVRYVDLGRIEAGDRADPDQFTKEELAKLLG
jgi:DNA primase